MEGRARSLSKRLASFTGIGGSALVRLLTRIAKTHGERVEISKVFAESTPSGFKAQYQIQKGYKIVDFEELDISLAEPGFKVFLRTLLGVKTCTVVVRVFPRSRLAQ